MGSLRATQEAMEQAEATLKEEAIESMQRTLDRKRKLVEAKVAQLNAEFEQEVEESKKIIVEAKLRQQVLTKQRKDMAVRRGSGGENQSKEKGTS